MKRMLAMGLVAALALAGIQACGGRSGGGAQPVGRKLTIAVIPKGTTHEFWKSVHAGAIKASQELDVDLLWQGPLREDDREEQIKVVDTIRARQVSGIALAPLDDKALRLPVRDAVRSGIPVLIFDSGLASEDYVSLVETDNYKGGRVAGEHLVSLLSGTGNVIVLRLHEGAASTTQREQGFLDVMAATPAIKVVSSNQYAGASTEGSYKASENLLTATRAASGGVNGIFCPNESTTFGMLRALQDARLAGKIRFVGFDTSDKMVQALRDGELDALVLQDPFKMGYLAVKTLVRHIKGEKVEKHIDTGATLVTKANMDQPDIRDRLQPKLEGLIK
jgi:ribose transport system substrate-binding protein